MGEARQQIRGVLPSGTRLGRYELVRRLARGGMAELYLARARGMAGFEKLVVLKLVLPHLAENREFVEMFLGEARLAATLDHPNIVHVTDIGQLDGEPFFVMEYVHGQDLGAILRAAIKAEQPIPLRVGLTICAGIASGLHYVHERRAPDGNFLGLVHRDVSPANVVVSYDGGVKLVDFGIAKATHQHTSTRAGVVKGKISYMAPEQCHGDAVDRRTDVFALGILLYEVTTGQRAFTGGNDFYIMSRIARGTFATPSEIVSGYPPQLEGIVLRALAVDPDARYATAQDVAVDLEAFAHAEHLQLSGLSLATYLRALFGDQPHPGAQPDDNSPTALHPDAVRFPSRALSKAGLLPPTHIGERCELSTSDDTLIGASDATPTSDTMIATTQPLGPETVEETVVAWAPEPSWFERWPVRRAATITLAALGAGLAGAMTAFFTLGETEDVPPRPSIEVVEVPVMLEREDPPPVIPAPPAIEPEAIEDSPLPETADAQTDIDTDGASVEVASEATPKSSAPKRHRRPRHKKRTRAKTRTTKKKTDLDAMYPAGGRR